MSAAAKMVDLPRAKRAWQTRALGTVVTFLGGGTPSKQRDDYWSGDIPWVSPKDMKSDVVTGSIDKITSAAVDGSAVKLIPVGALLVVVRSGILARTIPTALTGVTLTINQDLKALVPTADLDVQFLAHFMRSAEHKLLASVSRGATVHRLATDALKSLAIPVPPLDEQKRIVVVLDQAFAALDRARAHAEANLADAQRLFEALVTEKFSARESWPRKDLGSRVRFIDYRGKTPPKSESGIRLITAKNVRMGFVKDDPAEFVPEDVYDSWMTRGIPKRGDVLFTTEAPLANVAQLETDDKVVIGQRLITMQAHDTKIDRSFLKWSLLVRCRVILLSNGYGV